MNKENTSEASSYDLIIQTKTGNILIKEVSAANTQNKQSSEKGLNEALTDAEIIWVLEVVLKKYLLNSCGNRKIFLKLCFNIVTLLNYLAVEI